LAKESGFRMSALKQFLLVDDSRISRLMLKAIIQSQYPEWRIAEAENAKVALGMCSDGDYDFISLDMNMPGIDGLTISPQLQKACPNAKIALLTANLHERVKEQAKEQGLIFIPKPITESKILTFLKESLSDD